MMWKPLKFGLVVAFVAVQALAVAIAPAADPKDKDKKTLEDKGAEKATAASVDFQAKLGMQLDVLKSMGARIDGARSRTDPVSLASAARDLQAAEGASGKTATIKSADLIKEAAEMARYRNKPAELRMVAKLFANDDAVKGFGDMAEKLEKAQEARSKGSIGVDKDKGITNKLYVVNQTSYYVDIYVNYAFVGSVAPYDAGWIAVGDSPFDTTVLYAKAPGTAVTWGARYVNESVKDFTWKLTY